MDEAVELSHEEYAHLAQYRKCVERIRAEWERFRSKREQRLVQERRYGEAREPVAEGILEDLFTDVLDWPLGNFNRQVQRADIVLTDLGIKKLIIEAKHPGALRWNRAAVDRALGQARRYAEKQSVKVIAVSDGEMLYAADRKDGGLRDRIYVSLRGEKPPLDLWWLSREGIYRDPSYSGNSLLPPPAEDSTAALAKAIGEQVSETLLNPKHGLPARCYAYVGDSGKTSTWKLPYLGVDGSTDVGRLPFAINSILKNFHGQRVKGIPETAIPAVLLRLARAADLVGLMPPRASNPREPYRRLQEAMEQFGVSIEDTPNAPNG